MDLRNLLDREPERINCQEAYSIWDILSAKYQFLEKLEMWQNFAHDKSLKSLIDIL